MYSRIALITSIVFGAALIGGAALSFKLFQVQSETAQKIQDSLQESLEINYRLDNAYRGSVKENGRLKDTAKQLQDKLDVQTRLAKEQQRLIGVQQQLGAEQSGKIHGLENQLGGAKTQIEELKKVGGEPLPKDFINSLLQATIRIRCLLSRAGNTQNFRAGSGSLLGKYSAVSGDYVIMTNAHVIAPNETTGKADCSIVFGDNAVYSAPLVRQVLEPGYDFAFLRLGSPRFADATVTPVSYEELGVGFCEFNDVEIGDRITVLSFPGFTTPDKAVLEGNITDILDGPIYEASAIIDQGSSGGVAILNKKRCALGMPTWKGVGTKLGIAYIQSWSMMLSYKH